MDSPVSTAERISSVDMLRGFALLGILLMNIQDFGLPSAAYENPLAFGGATGWNLYYWIANQVLFEGKMRFLFSLLFGAGTILLTERAEQRGAGVATADIYLRRCLWLALFGIIHAYLIWSGDILFHYGVLGLGLFTFRTLAVRGLLIAAAIVFLLSNVGGAGMAVSQAQTREQGIAAARVAPDKRTEAQKKAFEQYQSTLDQEDWVKRREGIDKQIKAYRGTWAEALAERARHAFTWQTVFFYKFGLTDTLFAMFLGMALYKAGILGAARNKRFYLAGALVGYALGVPLLTHQTLQVVHSGWDPWTRPLLNSTYEYGRLTVGLAHLCLLLFVYKLGWFAWVTAALAKVGQMALTNYLLTSILMTLYFNGYGLGNYAKLERHQLLFVVAGMWSINLVLSPLWLSRFRFGPVEWLWRSLTYWKRQPFRLHSPIAGSSSSEPAPS
jgi:uncharacterized protein